MKKYVKILIALGVLVVISVALFYGGFALLLFSSDMASYYSDETYLGPVEFDEVLVNAENQGYDVSTRWVDTSNGFEPGNVEEVAERFDSGYVVSRVEINSGESSYLEARRYDNVTSLVFTNHTHASLSEPLEPSEFPDERWMLDTIGLMFDLDENASEKYLEELKYQTANSTGFSVWIEINETLDFPTVYTYLNESSKESVFTPGMWNDEEFYRNGKRLGYVAYLVPEATISTEENSNEYSIDINSEGFAALGIKMPRFSSGDEIPEEEYEATFREMFENLGLPPEKVKEFEFEYSPSVW